MKKQSVFATVFILASFLQSAFAGTFTWKGGSGNFTDASKWQPMGVPGIGDDVVFPSNTGLVTLGGIQVVGSITFRGGGINNGTLMLQNGGLWEDGNIESGATLQIDTFAVLTVQKAVGNTKSIYFGQVINFGTVQWLDTDLNLASNATFRNSGVFLLTDATSSFFSSGSGTQFINEKRFIYNAPNGNCNFTQVMRNQPGGIFEVQAGRLRLGTTAFNKGNLLTNGGAVTEIGFFTYIETGGTVNGSGTVRVSGGELFFNTPTSTGSMIELNYGVVKGSASLEVLSNFNWKSGYLEVPVTVAAGGTMRLQPGGDKTLNTKITNNGLIDWTGGALYFNTPQLVNNNSMIVRGNQNIYGPAGNTLVNNGVLVMDAAAKLTCRIGINNTITGALEARAGSELYWQNGPLTNNGVMRGQGFFNHTGGITNNGIFAPGLQTGDLKTGPDYTNKELNIAIQNNDGGHSRLNVNGFVNLRGKLNIFEANTIAANDTFEIITCNGSANCIRGVFDSLNVPAGYSIVYGANKVIAIKTVAAAQRSLAVPVTEESAVITAGPNPFSNSLRIKMPGNNTSNIVVRNLAGAQVFSARTNNNLMNINTAEWAAGMYIAEVSNTNGMKKVIKLVK